jgi:hypothetical protein
MDENGLPLRAANLARRARLSAIACRLVIGGSRICYSSFHASRCMVDQRTKIFLSMFRRATGFS